MTTPRPMSQWGPEEIEAWAKRVRAERVSDTGRAMVDLAAAALLEAQGTMEPADLAKLLLAVDKLARCAMQGDKQHLDNALEELREKLRTGDVLASELEGLH